MSTEKIDREILANILTETLSKSVTFKHIEGINPCLISFDGIEFYVYIKNITNTAFPNQNPEIKRIQLPRRKPFEAIKESKIPFIFLGYDKDNDVYTTWNPHWAKQRLNVAKNVSFYSRLTAQEQANITQEIQCAKLQNDSDVIAIPREKIGYYLLNINHFFPEMTEYVAMGSSKRTEANEAFKTLCKHTNISEFAKYLTKNSYAEKTIGNYCQAINKLMKEGHFSKNRRIFLACDSLTQYPDVIKSFIDVPEVKELNDIWHYTFSAALKAYINFLLATQFQSEEEANNNSPELSNTTQTDSRVKKEEVLKEFTTFLSEKRLSERSIEIYVNAMEKIIDKGYSVDFLRAINKFEDIPQAIATTLAIAEVEEMNRKWKGIFSAVLNYYGQFWADFLDRVHKLNESIKEKEAKIIALEKPLNKPKEEVPNQTEEEIDWDNFDWEAPFINENGKLTKILNPVLVEQLKPCLTSEYGSITTALAIIEDFYAERFKTMEIKDWIVLIDTIHWGDPRELVLQSNNNQSGGKKGKTHILKVTTPEGDVFEENRVSETLVKIVEYAGVENVQSLNINISGDNIVVDEDSINPKYKSGTKYVANGLYVNTCSDTAAKYTIIQEISDRLELGLNVEFVGLDGSTDIPFTKPITGATRKKIRVEFPDGRVIKHTRVLETLIEVVEYAGAENVQSLNINVSGDNIIVDKDSINPKYKTATKHIANGLYVNTCSDTDAKYVIIQEISDRLGLGLNIELIGLDGSVTTPTYPILNTTRNKIRVEFPDGRVIRHTRVLDTLIEVIQYAGVENVRKLKIGINNDNLITDIVTSTYKVSLKPLGNGLFVHTNSGTDTKLEQIQRISESLNLGLIAEMI